MEKKTIGAFIASLRKVSGMTQKDLAEKLSVSDKTVSHWERDESAPDLSLIPVIAEIFGVTCDELLRGERIKYVSEEPSGKTEKQLKYLLERSRTKLRTHSMISLGLSIAGMFTALLCNFGFNLAYVGFIVGCIFWAAAIICEWVLCSYAFSSVSGNDFDGAELNDYKIFGVRMTAKIISVTVIMIGASLPLIMIPNGSYQGVTAVAWLLWGLFTGAITAFICLATVHKVNNSLISKGVYKLEKSEDIKLHNLRRLKLRCASVTLAVLLVLLMGQAIFNGAVGQEAFVAGTSFDNLDDFKAYMETEKDGEMYIGDQAPEQVLGDAAGEQIMGTNQYSDAFGNPITKEQAYTEELYDNNGNVVCSYVHLNQEVVMIRYTGAGTDKFSVTTYTFEQLSQGEAGKSFINARWIILYFAAAAAGLIVYVRKRAKLV